MNNNNKYNFSVIIPIYNVENYLEQCIDSILVQKIKNLELILVNDGSNDKSKEIAESYHQRFDFIKLINKPNGGLSSARNAGLNIAEGKYVVFMDSDDFVDTNFKKICELTLSKDVDIVKGKYRLYYDSEKKFKELEQREINSLNTILLGIDFLKEAINHDVYEVVTVINVYKKSFLVDNKLWFEEGRFYEDHEHTLKCLIIPGVKVIQTDFVFYNYRQRSSSITKKPTIKKVDDIMKNIKSINNHIEKAQVNYEYKTYMYRAMSMLYYQMTSVYGRLSVSDKKEVLNKVSREASKKAQKFPMNRHQYIKILLFNKSPYLVDLIYSMRNNK